MQTREEIFLLPGGDLRKVTVYGTIHGPVITEVKEGVVAVIALKWYGTLSKGQLPPMRSLRAFQSLNLARTLDEAIAAGEVFEVLGENLVVADVRGNIGWHVTGSVPIRRGYSGRLPADGFSGTMGWAGFVPYEELPGGSNPGEGWLATANSRPESAEDSPHISFSWSAPYRYERIKELIANLPAPSADDFQDIQMDVYSLRAERLLPRVVAYPFSNPLAQEAARQLEGWDRMVTTESVGAKVYEVFLTEWVRSLLEDELGTDLAYYSSAILTKYSVIDVILDHPDSHLWDRIETPGQEGPQEILEMALSRTMTWLEAQFGGSTASWAWGRLHTLNYIHPMAATVPLYRAANLGPLAIPGDDATVNIGASRPVSQRYSVVVIPSMRVVMPLGNLGQTRIIAPIGQSGQTGHPHYGDMVAGWLAGELVPLSASREELAQDENVQELVLSP